MPFGIRHYRVESILDNKFKDLHSSSGVVSNSGNREVIFLLFFVVLIGVMRNELLAI